jgi:hypothetical protein
LTIQAAIPSQSDEVPLSSSNCQAENISVLVNTSNQFSHLHVHAIEQFAVALLVPAQVVLKLLYRKHFNTLAKTSHTKTKRMNCHNLTCTYTP